MFDRLLTLGYESVMLAFESQHVIALRLMHLAQGGPRALGESQLMVVEKAVAAVESSVRLAAGHGPDAIVRSYRRKVRANRQRLEFGYSAA